MNLFSLDPADDTAAYKACCAVAYESPLLTYLLGRTWRPGGLELTLEMARAADVTSSARVLDVASGAGETARHLATECGSGVVAVDLSLANLAASAARSNGAAVGHIGADAESLPFGPETFDVVVCECSYCTFPDKHSAMREIARVLRPGGRLALADVSVAPGSLPEALAGAWGRVACLADALPQEEYVRNVEAAGLEVTVVQDCREAALAFLKSIDSRLMLMRIGQAVGRFDTGGIDIREARALLKEAVALVEAGRISYFYLIAAKP